MNVYHDIFAIKIKAIVNANISTTALYLLLLALSYAFSFIYPKQYLNSVQTNNPNKDRLQNTHIFIRN